jgi:hypothetical protein
MFDDGAGFTVWIDWFQRRIDGQTTGFDLSPAADAEICHRLIDASEDWWNREPRLVNADIQNWIDELTPQPDFTAFQARIDAGATPQFGSDQERDRRADLQKQIAALNEQMENLEQAPAPIGHNRPPLDLEVADVEDAPAVLQETRILTASLATEIVAEKPDIVATLDKLRRLKAIGKWLGRKAD